MRSAFVPTVPLESKNTLLATSLAQADLRFGKL